jgi:hypothetical protein
MLADVVDGHGVEDPTGVVQDAADGVVRVGIGDHDAHLRCQDRVPTMQGGAADDGGISESY